MEQNFTNTFKNLPTKPYCLICAGEGQNNIDLPDGSKINASDVKHNLNFAQLYAWNLEGKALLESVNYLKENPNQYYLVVDSGAYSAWSRGKKFDIDEYINFLNSNNVLDTALWAAEADVIPGSFGVDPTEEERLNAPEKSWQNYLYMIDRVTWPKKIVPIFHMGEDYKHLRRMLSFKFKDGDFIPFIGISPRNDVHTNEKIKWYEKTWSIIFEECLKLGRSIPLTHNFGMTSLPVIEQFPSFSSDSTSAIRSSSFGNVMFVINGKVKTVYVSDRNPNSPDHINNQPLAVREAVEKLCQEIGHGITLDHLINHDEKGGLRLLCSIYSLDKWRKNFEFHPNANSFKEELW